MEEYLDALILNMFNVILKNHEKDKCLFEFNFSVEKVLYVIFMFSKNYNIDILCFQKNIEICSYNEILKIGKKHNKSDI